MRFFYVFTYFTCFCCVFVVSVVRLHVLVVFYTFCVRLHVPAITLTPSFVFTSRPPPPNLCCSYGGGCSGVVWCRLGVLGDCLGISFGASLGLMICYVFLKGT